MARERILSRLGHFAKRGMVSASLTCGAATPLYEMARSLDKSGTPISTILLVDSDEMALAAAVSLARSRGVEDRVILYHKDLFRHRLTSYIKPESVDLVDLLGLVDWVPAELRDRKTGLVRHRPIQRLLSDVRDIVRAGGMILVGNMLNKRPQQAFVERVWPPLFQRGVREMLSIIATAGYDPMTVQVRIPGREGVYAVYGIPIP
jgi:SAM-dependent methyltransferase